MHRALGLAGRARGVDQDREVIGPARGTRASNWPGCARRGARAELAQRRQATARADRRSRAARRCRIRRSTRAAAGGSRTSSALSSCSSSSTNRMRVARIGAARTRPAAVRRSDRCRSRRRRRESTARSASTHSTTVLARIEAQSPGCEAERRAAHRRSRGPAPTLRQLQRAPDAQLLLAQSGRVATRRDRVPEQLESSRRAGRRPGAPQLGQTSQRFIARSSSASSAARRARRLPSCRGRTP